MLWLRMSSVKGVLQGIAALLHDKEFPFSGALVTSLVEASLYLRCMRVCDISAHLPCMEVRIRLARSVLGTGSVEYSYT